MFFIDEKRCIGCRQCVEICPAGAITIQNALAAIDQAKCRQCGVCVEECPVQAIAESAQASVSQAKLSGNRPQQQPGIFSGIVDRVNQLAGKFFGQRAQRMPAQRGKGQGRRSGRGGGRGRNSSGKGRGKR